MKLYQHQTEGIEFLKAAKRAILADEMGLGKTAQAIKAADHYKTTIVVCPASIKINWKREIKALYPKDDVLLISGRKSPPASISSFSGGFPDWFIINYDILAYHADWISAVSEQIGTLILDEAHYIKGRTKRTEAAMKVASGIDRIYCLTGTPLVNRPIELFNQLKIIGHPSGRNRTEFAKRYCGAFFMRQVLNLYDGRKVMMPEKTAFGLNPSTWKMTHIRFLNETGATNLEELRELVKPVMLRRKKDEVLGLPAKTIQIVEVDLKASQRKRYETAWNDYIEFLRENPPVNTTLDNVLSARHLVEITKLKQVCSDEKLHRIIEDALNAIEQGEKIIIFSQYTETIAKISSAMTLKKITNFTLTGSDSTEARQESVDKFQSCNEPAVFVANIKAAGFGINLTAASIVIFADMAWSPEDHSQAEDRAHRIGQSGTVNVYYYVCKDTIEEDIIQLLAEKKAMIREVIDGTGNRVKGVSVMADFIKRMGSKLSTD